MTRKAIVLIGEGFEDSEMLYPYYRIQEAGFETDLVGPEAGATYHGKHGVPLKADRSAGEVDINDYDVLLIPGGQQPDHLRIDRDVVDLVRQAVRNDIVVAAVCHAGQLLIEADVVKGRRMTGWPSIRTDLRNAGADVVDEEVVVDGQLVTSRKPADLPAFMRETVRLLESAPKQQTAAAHRSS